MIKTLINFLFLISLKTTQSLVLDPAIFSGYCKKQYFFFLTFKIAY